MTETEKNKLLKEYFCAVVPEDVIIFDKIGQIWINGQKQTVGEISSLYEEAKFFKESRLYKILINHLKVMAMEVMYNKSESYDDMRNGKMMLYNLSVQQNIVNNILKFGKKK